MLPDPVIDLQVAGQPPVPFVGVLVAHGLGPFASQGLDQSRGLPFGSGLVGPGADVPEHQGAAGLGSVFELGRSVTTSILSFGKGVRPAKATLHLLL